MNIIMKYKILNTIFIFNALMLVLSCQNPTSLPHQEMELDSDWVFKSEKDSVWRSAKVPSVVQLDLLEHKQIPEPFYADNESKIQWVGEQNWWYKTMLNLSDYKHYDNVQLVFEGLDTYAKVYLNDTLCLSADNMYRTWTIDLKKDGKFLYSGLEHNKNIDLSILFLAPEPIEQKKSDSLTYTLPDKRAFTRKAPFHYGWDWGAKILTAGIWKPVKLNLWNDMRLKTMQITPDFDLFDFDSDSILNVTLGFSVELEKASDYSVQLLNTKTNKVVAEKAFQQAKGVHSGTLSFQEKDVNLWWCNGMGEAYLYDYQLRLLKNNKLIDTLSQRVGYRKIELVQETDSIGRSFYFRLNNRPVFVKGANYIPSDHFSSRVKPKQQKRLLDQALWANMNMIRVWGGGIYETDEFYDYCDEKGLMVWQDFMFSCTMYPGDAAFLSNVKQEIKEQIVRLRHHSSIVLWCGNNEVDNGWKDWGWQKQFKYSKEDEKHIEQAYNDVFKQLIPQLIHQHDSLRDYWASSPEYGWGHPENFTYGDSHYWGVWWGMEPFEVFDVKYGRFMSEYGFQAFPSMASLKEFNPKNQMYMGSESMQTHQKHPRGYSTIDTYLQRDFRVSKRFEDYVYLSQILQAEGIGRAIKIHRLKEPYCMGTLYWQFNDSWPVISWSSVDYYGRRKALHYKVRDRFKPIVLLSQKEANDFVLYLRANTLESHHLKVQAQLNDFNGKSEKEILNQDISITGDTLIELYRESVSVLEENRFVYACLFHNEKEIDDDYFFSKKSKEYHYPKAEIQVDWRKKSDTLYQLTLKSDALVRALNIEVPEKGEWSDNFFNLYPNKSKTVYFNTSLSRSILQKDIRMKSLSDI